MVINYNYDRCMTKRKFATRNSWQIVEGASVISLNSSTPLTNWGLN